MINSNFREKTTGLNNINKSQTIIASSFCVKTFTHWTEQMKIKKNPVTS